MPVKEINKKIKFGVIPPRTSDENLSTVVKEKPAVKKNNSEKDKKEMTTEQIDRMEGLVQDINVPKQVKVVKKDKGLIERTESSKIILTEDNRQVLTD